MPEFDINAFIEGVEKDHSVVRGSNDRIQRVLMNVKGNQGTVTILPFISKKIGNIYKKIEGVKEYYGRTSLIDNGEGWYKIMPLEMYGELTPEQIELYNEVSGLYDKFVELSEGDYSVARSRNYSLFTGLCLNHVNTEGAKVEDYIDSACVFVFPSNSPIDALNTAIANKRNVMKERTPIWLSGIITPANKGRRGVIVLNFKKNDGPGYGTSITFETNNADEGIIVIDPEREFDEEFIRKFDDPVQVFLGWGYDYDNKKYFNETYFKELRDSLKLDIKAYSVPTETTSESTENKNGSVDPMKAEMPPIPGVEQKVASKPTSAPF